MVAPSSSTAKISRWFPESRSRREAPSVPIESVNRGGLDIDWRLGNNSPLRDYFEVLGVIVAVTTVGWFLPVSYHALGHVYLLVVILLCLRVGRWPGLFAAVVSALAWNYVFMPPRMSFSVLEFDDGILLGIYFVVAIIAGQLTTRIRAQERQERLREQRSTVLFHLTRALAGARSLDEAVAAALRQAENLFNAQAALLLTREKGGLTPHPAGSFRLDEQEHAVAEWAAHNRRDAGRFTGVLGYAEGLHIPMRRADQIFGVFAVRLPLEVTELTPVQRDFIEGFAAQIALLVEREQLRAASEREKFFAESDRLHRTLLDSVSHELKTPLAVLRSAGDKLDTDDAAKRASLAGEIRTATRRLDHLVANLLNQTRLESGGLRPQPDWCDVRDLITAARQAAGEALAGRSLTTRVPADLPLFRVDAPLMEQVLGNLLLNAGLHTPAGSPILVSAGLERRGGGEWVYIRVEDRGPGIPPELGATLFQKFRRGRAARAGGLGLGLAIARGFMLAQGGDLAAGDNPEGGARFTAYLPHTAHGSVPNDEH